MRYIAIIIGLLAFFSKLGAQDPVFEYNYSEEIELRPQDEYDGLVKADDTGYLISIFENGGRGILDMPGNRLVLEKYDPDFKQVFSYEYGDEKMVTLDLVAMDNFLAWIVMEKVGSYKYACSFIPISLDGKQGKKEFLYETPIEKLTEFPYTFVQKSPDGQQLSVIALFDGNSKKEPVEIFSTIINNKGTIQWDKFTSLRGNQKQYEISDFQVTDSGEIIFVSKVYKDEKAKSTKKNRRNEEVAGYSMNLFKLNQSTSKPTKIALEVEGQFVHDASIKILESGDIICSGLTSLKHKGNITGVFYSRYKDDFTIVENDIENFNFNELVDLSQEKIDVNVKRKKKMGIDHTYDLGDIIPLSDGSIYLTLEQNYIRITNNSNSFNNTGFNNGLNTGFNSRQQRDAYLISNDILVINVSNKGQISKINVVPKKQRDHVYSGYYRPLIDLEKTKKTSLYLSHSYFIDDDQVFFIFNDHKDNLAEPNRNRRKTVGRLKDMEAALISYDNDVMPGYFFTEEDADLLLSPTRSEQIADDKLFFSTMRSAGRKNFLRLGTLRF